MKFKEQPKIAIIMGSISDKPVMQEAQKALNEMQIMSDMLIVSAHRTPEWMYEFAQNAKKSGYQVIIAGAGGAAHLPGMVASLTSLPVIGVPITVGKMNGLDALLSIAQMPKGVPVACVAVDNAYNAGLLAARIIGTTDKAISQLVEQAQAKKKNEVLKIRNIKLNKKNK